MQLLAPLHAPLVEPHLERSWEETSLPPQHAGQLQGLLHKYTSVIYLLKIHTMHRQLATQLHLKALGHNIMLKVMTRQRLTLACGNAILQFFVQFLLIRPQKSRLKQLRLK